MIRKSTRVACALLICLLSLATSAQQPAGSVTLFQNVRVFDSVRGELTSPRNVLIRGNVIERISTDPIPTDRRADTVLVEGGGRTLMPGLIDAHVHMMFATIPQAAALTSDLGFINVAAVRGARDMLMRGFTSVRDLGGPVFGLKRGIDAGLVDGPRIWPSGAFISQTGGHGDFRLPNELPAAPGNFSFTERIGGAAIADSPDLVRQRVREQLALGATQIKLMAGGGVASTYDPLDVTQYTVAGAARRGRSRRELGHLRHRARLYAARRAAGARGRRHVHRPRTSAGRGDRPPHGREERLVEPAAVHRRSAIPVSRRLAKSGEAARDVQRHGRRLCAGQEVQDQDGVGHGHTLRCRHRRTPGRDAGQDGRDGIRRPRR